MARSQKQTKFITIRVSPTQKARLETSARRVGLPLSIYVRDSLIITDYHATDPLTWRRAITAAIARGLPPNP